MTGCAINQCNRQAIQGENWARYCQSDVIVNVICFLKMMLQVSTAFITTRLEGFPSTMNQVKVYTLSSDSSCQNYGFASICSTCSSAELHVLLLLRSPRSRAPVCRFCAILGVAKGWPLPLPFVRLDVLSPPPLRIAPPGTVSVQVLQGTLAWKMTPSAQNLSP